MKWTTEQKVGVGVAGALAIYGLTQLFKPSPPPDGVIVLDGHVTYADTNDPAGGQQVELDDTAVTTDEDGYYAFPSIVKGTHLLKCQLPDYKPFLKTLSITKSLTINISLIPVEFGDLYVRWMKVTPEVVVLGNAVEIEAEVMAGGKFGSFVIDCIVDGTMLQDTCTFSETQQFYHAHYAFTPTRLGQYTAVVLGFSETFNVAPNIVRHLECPYGGVPEPPYGLDYWESVPELTTEDLLARHIGNPWTGHSWGWGEGGGYEMYCPYCDWYFRAGDWLSLGYQAVNHIKAHHALICPIDNKDLTFAATAVDRGQAWIQEMGAHGITMPAVNIEGEPSPMSSMVAASMSDWIREVGASLCVLGQGKPALYYFGSDEGVPIVDAISAEIPELAGRNWSASLGTWCAGYPYYGEYASFDLLTEIAGSGSIISFEQVATFSDWGARYFGLTLIVQCEGDTIVVPNAWRLVQPIGPPPPDETAMCIARLEEARAILTNWIMGGWGPFGESMAYFGHILGINHLFAGRPAGPGCPAVPGYPSLAEVEAAYERLAALC